MLSRRSCLAIYHCSVSIQNMYGRTLLDRKCTRLSERWLKKIEICLLWHVGKRKLNRLKFCFFVLNIDPDFFRTLYVARFLFSIDFKQNIFLHKYVRNLTISLLSELSSSSIQTLIYLDKMTALSIQIEYLKEKIQQLHQEIQTPRKNVSESIEK